MSYSKFLETNGPVRTRKNNTFIIEQSTQKKINDLPIVCDRKLFPNLTEKQRRFVEAWVVTGNSSESARVAGYSVNCDRQIGFDNLSKPDILEAIEKYITLLRNKTGISPETILNRMELIAQRNLVGQVLENEEGEIVDIVGMDESLAIKATEVQARILEIGGYAKSKGININNNNNMNIQQNHTYNLKLLSDEEKDQLKGLLSKCIVVNEKEGEK